jgi:hypothetical protein
VSHEDLISTYRASCKKHGTSPLPHVLNQLKVRDTVKNKHDLLKIADFWDVAPCILRNCPTLYENIMMMAAVSNSRTSVSFYQTLRWEKER